MGGGSYYTDTPLSPSELLVTQNFLPLDTSKKGDLLLLPGTSRQPNMNLHSSFILHSIGNVTLEWRGERNNKYVCIYQMIIATTRHLAVYKRRNEWFFYWYDVR